MISSFSPAISNKSEKAIRDSIRSWKIYTRTGSELSQLPEELKPLLRGWLNCCGKFRRSILFGISDMLQTCLVKWTKRKYKKLKGAGIMLTLSYQRLHNRNKSTLLAANGLLEKWLNMKNRMTGDCQVRFREKLKV